MALFLPVPLLTVAVVCIDCSCQTMYQEAGSRSWVLQSLQSSKELPKNPWSDEDAESPDSVSVSKSCHSPVLLPILVHLDSSTGHSEVSCCLKSSSTQLAVSESWNCLSCSLPNQLNLGQSALICAVRSGLAPFDLLGCVQCFCLSAVPEEFLLWGSVF